MKNTRTFPFFKLEQMLEGLYRSCVSRNYEILWKIVSPEMFYGLENTVRGRECKTARQVWLQNCVRPKILEEYHSIRKTELLSTVPFRQSPVYYRILVTLRSDKTSHLIRLRYFSCILSHRFFSSKKTFSPSSPCHSDFRSIIVSYGALRT